MNYADDQQQSISDGEDDSYLASVSDLMVGLLFIFIIILMSFALKLRTAEDQTEVQAHIKAEQTQQLREITASLTRDTEMRNRMLEQIRSSLEQRGVKVHLDLRNGVLRLPEELLFDSASATFREQGKVAVAQLALALAVILPCYSMPPSTEPLCQGAQSIRLDAILIEGHTDNRPIRTSIFSDNWALSNARAKNTYDELLSASPVLAMMTNVQAQPLFSMSAYADTRPVAGNDFDENRRRNRRIDLRFILATPDQTEVGKIQQQLIEPSQ